MLQNYISFFHSFFGKTLYIILQLTWGVLQSLLGFMLFIYFYQSAHDCYFGSIRTKWPLRGGLSLGLFIFTPDERNMSANSSQYSKAKWQEYCQQVSVHEYGHSIQSIILGPLYLLTIGIISFTWSQSAYFQKKRKELTIPYSACWTEKWANQLGESILKKPSIHH